MALLPVRRSGLPLFHIVLIKPTHYDDDGYPIRWFRAAIPSNTLGALYSLADDVRRRQVLGRRSTSAFTPLTKPTSACSPRASSGKFVKAADGR